MKKLFLLFLISIFFLGGTVLGAEEGKEIEEQSQKFDIDIKTAVDMVLKENLDLKIASLNLKKAELEYKKREASNLSSQSQYSEKEAEYSLASARKNYEDTYNNLIHQVIDIYSKVWLQELDLEIKEKQVQLEKKLLKEARAQREIGEIGRIDLLEAENAYKDAQFNLETSRDNNVQYLRELQTVLGIGKKDFKLTAFKAPHVWDITEEKSLEQALNNSEELKLQNKALELASLDLKKAEVTASRLDREIKEIELKKTEISKKNTRETIKNNSRDQFYQFRQSQKQMNLKEERLQEAREKYNLQQQQYEAGLITSTEVLQYEVNMKQAQYNYLSALADYYLREFSLREVMNMEIDVAEVFTYEDSQK